MLFKEIHLQGIRSGSINLAFRKWEKESVKKGTLLKTSIGLVEINDIEVVEEHDISDADAIQAGFTGKQQLLKSFPSNTKALIFKISVSYHSEDPRIELREQTNLTHEEFNKLKQKLERLDYFSKQGAWTISVLHTIKDNPHLPAIEISKLLGFEKEWLKLNIRKLKNLGLTISHHAGYEISPFGKLFVEKLASEE